MSGIYDRTKSGKHSKFDRVHENTGHVSVDPWDPVESSGVLPPSNVPSNQNYRTVQLHVRSGSPLFPSEMSERAAAEQYRIIRTKIAHHRNKPRVIAVSSACSQDGKTVTSINIAASLAAKPGASVLLIDADLRRHRVSEVLGIPIAPGLSNILSGSAGLESAVVRVAQRPQLFVLPTGRSAVHPVELLDCDRWRAVLLHLVTQFTYIIIDATPINTVADYELVELAADGIILVVRPDHTDRHACAKMFDTVQKDKLIGVVVNCVKDWWLSKTPAYEYYQKLPDDER